MSERDTIHQRDQEILDRLARARDEGDPGPNPDDGPPPGWDAPLPGGPVYKADKPAQPLADPAACTLGALGWAEQDPPPREWLLADVLPLGECGLIAAPGASSKTWLLLQMALGVAGGLGIAGHGMAPACYEPAAARPVLVLTAEEQQADLHRRVHRILSVMREAGTLPDLALAAMRENLRLLSARGEDSLVRVRQPGSLKYENTEYAKRIEATLEQLPGLGLLIIEPASRFRPGDENDAAATTGFVSWLERISMRYGCTVLTASHVNKWSKQEEEITADSIRGSSALVDSLRWVTVMRIATKAEREKYSIPEDEKGRYVQVATVKANNVSSIPPFWLERTQAGVLRAVRMGPAQAQPTAVQRVNEQDYQRVAGLVDEYVRKHPGEYNRKALLADHGHASGLFGCHEKKLRAILGRMLDEGRIALGEGGKLLPG